ncbi:hypothetical protein [Actinoplanes sp. NPDC049118]|uniref:hypothetical protein n=1 Tax=Actinoplanes sp. NPDC049118 TaxID=3155769 RepID=UPI0033F01A70
MAVSIGVPVLLLGMVAVVEPAAAATAPAGKCTVDATNPAKVGMTRAADGTLHHTQWLEQEGVVAANLAIQKAVETQFGLTDQKATAAAVVRTGYLGTAVDHNTQTLVTVVTPEYAAKAATFRGKVAAATPALPVGVSTAVIVGCNSGAELAAGADLLTGRAWHPDAAKATFGFGIDAADSRIHASFAPKDKAAAEAAQKALGDLAVVTLDGAARTGRLDDGTPHFGGAGVRVGSGSLNSNICTTAFTVRRNSNGQRGGISAGHCFNNDQSIWSSTKFWGNGWGRANYPAFDMIGISATSQTYDNTIHVDPCCPTTRNVTSRKAPAVNDSVCQSGMITRAICGLVITNLFAQLCDADGCTSGLLDAHRGTDTVIRGGDSGGPIYIRSGSSNAVAVGLNVGTTSGGSNLVGEKLSSIESHLGVTILTS